MYRRIVQVGAGGIGTWVVLLAPRGTTIFVYDDDKVEGSNLNRAPFLLEHIGQPKVRALADLVKKYELGIEVIPVEKRVTPTTQFPDDIELVVDVTDRMAVRKLVARLAKAHGVPYVGLGYDGFRVTIFDYDTVMASFSTSLQGGYQFVPSFVAPPVWLAAKFWKGEWKPITKELGVKS